VSRVRFGVDEDTCTGDHACIRLSGCPTLTLKDNPDPLKVDPVATVIDGLCRLRPVRRQRPCRHAVPELLPRRADQEPRWHERLLDGWRNTWRRALQPA